MKLIPAVFFQKKLNGVEAAVKTPERLEVFESELREVVGGALRSFGGSALSAGTASRLTTGGPDGSGGTTTYSGSAGWADVMQADDCTF